MQRHRVAVLVAGVFWAALPQLRAADVPPSGQKPHFVALRGDAAFRHGGPLLAAERLSDGKRVLTTCIDGYIRLWDLESGKELRRFGDGKVIPRGLALLAGGKTFVTSGADKQIREWDLESGEQLRAYTGPEKEIRRCVVSRDGARIVCGCDDGLIYVWAVGTPEPQAKLAGHGAGVWCVDISPDGKTLASGAMNGEVKLWSLASGKELRALTSHERKLNDVVFDPKGERLVTIGMDKTIRCLNVADGVKVWGFNTALPPFAAAWSPDGKVVAAGMAGNNLFLYEGANGKQKARLQTDSLPSPVLFNAFGTQVLVGVGQTLCRYDASELKCLFPPPESVSHIDSIETVWALPSGEVLTLASGRVLRWKGDSAERAGEYEDLDAKLRIAPDGKQGVLPAGEELKIVDLASIKNAATVECAGSAEDGCWTSGGLRVLVVTEAQAGGKARKALELWSGKLEKKLLALEGGFGHVGQAKLSGDGTLAFAVRDGDMLSAWDSGTGKALLNAKLPYKEKIPRIEVCHLDGTGALVASVGGRLLAWRRPKAGGAAPLEPVTAVGGKEQVLALPGALAFLCAHPGGRYFVANVMAEGGAQALWWGEVADDGLRLIEKVETPGAALSDSMAFSPDGKFLYAATDDTRYFVFEVK